MKKSEPSPALSAEQWASLRAGGGFRVRDFAGEVAFAYSHEYDRDNGRGVTVVHGNSIAGLFHAPAVRALNGRGE